ncbi:MAG: metallophosphoesterase [Spirochaetes bacterium GWB1_48_6]|nr:MAG: metallophosphoesterase [Spirochaetes bacterium GWB1_48_6]
MKILAVADHIDPLVYSSLIKTRFKDVDVILGAGDLPLEYYSYIVSTLNKPLLFVFGNHNLNRYDEIRHRKITDPRTWEENVKLENSLGAVFIGGQTYRVGKTLFAGMGGCMKYNDGENQYTEFQMFWKLVAMIPRLLLNKLRFGRYLDVFLTHASPRGVGDKSDLCHLGFKNFHWFLRFFKPAYLVHGHIHLYDLNESRSRLYDQTVVINAYDHIVIDLEDRK